MTVDYTNDSIAEAVTDMTSSLQWTTSADFSSHVSTPFLYSTSIQTYKTE